MKQMAHAGQRRWTRDEYERLIASGFPRG